MKPPAQNPLLVMVSYGCHGKCIYSYAAFVSMNYIAVRAILEGLIIIAFLEVDAPPATASCVRCGNGKNALNPIKTG